MAFDRRDLVLALIGAGDGQVAGVTRLQKYLFLLAQEYGLGVDAAEAEFQPYKFGPYSPRLYDDIQYLENVGFLESDHGRVSTKDVEELDFGFLAPKRRSSRPSGEELVEREGFYGSYLSEKDTGEAAESDLGPERQFRLTPQARDYLSKKLEGPDGAKVRRACSLLKQRFRTLSDLIEYVYSRYPEWTTESEIREHVLRK